MTKTYQENKNGGRTPPAVFESEQDIFVPVGVVLIEIEECSENRYEMERIPREVRN
jgi:hypothetical protein